MAKKNTSQSAQKLPVSADMLAVLKGTEKVETGMKGLRSKVAAFKKSMEDSGLEPLDVAGFIAEGGLLKPFQDGIKKAIEAQDALAKKVRANKGLKVPKVVHGETSANLEKFNKALDKVSLKIGQALLPAVNSIVTAMTPVITSIGQFLANNPYLVEGLAAAAVAFTVVTVGAMGLVSVLGILASPIGMAAAIIAGAVALIVIGARLITKHWSSISGLFSKMWAFTREAFDSGVTSVNEGLASMGASVGKTWDETVELFSAGVDSVTKFFDETVASATAGIEALSTKFSFSPREVMDKALATAGTVISDFFDSTIARAKAGIEALSAKFSFSPREVMDKALATASTVVSDFWDSAVANATTGIEKLKATFSFSPREVLSQALATAGGVVGDFYNGVVASAGAGVESLKAQFSWSPIQTINEAWQPVTGVFSALRDVIGASMASLQDGLRRVFDVLPVESATAAWGGVTGYFSGLWASLTTDAQSVKGVFGDLFGQSPLDLIKQKWEPVIVWFSDMWTKLQSLFGQVKELLGGHFSGFFETVTGSAATPAGAAGLNSPLPQSSSALIQQSAANNRTQLEGGLTVRFENAPAGLRTDQPQTNQPGLALSSRIGYRSLSMGGSNELA